ncbi:MAG: glycosyltransferase family 2 protein [Gracilibacteraceae bacterium]|jgi:dolichol-phosphate mannosyltransferase|nr:glycosyltransferase family 2 protein [Gracilibacteraceae bacterium]
MLALIIPVYNEAEQIHNNIDRIRVILEEAGIAHGFYLVDDGSTDGTWEELTRLSEACPHVHTIRLSRNFGKEAALCAALERADGDAFLILDADLQHPPEMIPEMEKLWREQGYDVVEGVKEGRGRESLLKRLAVRTFYGLFRKSTGIDLDAASDFKLLDRKVVEAWRRMPERNTFFRGMSAWLGFRRVQLPFVVQERTMGETKWSLRALIRLAAHSITSYTSAPLYVVSGLGAVLLLGAVIIGIQTLVSKLLGYAETGFTTVIILQLFIGSCVMMSLGVIGVYISKIYEETKKRPRYIIQELKNLDDARIPEAK